MVIWILHLHFSPPEVKGNDRSLFLAQQWQAAGHQVRVFTGQSGYPPNYFEKNNQVNTYFSKGVEVNVFPVVYHSKLSPLRRILIFRRFKFQLIQYLKKEKLPDLIYAISTPLETLAAGRKLSTIHKVPLVIELADVWPDVWYGMGLVRDRFSKAYWDNYTRRCYQAASLIVLLSPGMESLVCRLGAYKDKCFVSYNGTHVREFYPNPTPDLNDEYFRLFYTGSIGRVNGLQYLLEAANSLSQQGFLKIKIHLVGNGNDEERLKEMYYKLGSPETLVWEDSMSKNTLVHRLHQGKAGMVCFATYPVLSTNSSNKFYDYCAAGLPVIVNFEGWQAEMIRKEDMGAVVDPRNPESLVKVLQEWYNNPERARLLGIKARFVAEENFDREKIGKVLLEKLTNLFKVR
jgi:glycosyltransferase involved in cell wall biosynthesis